MWKRSSVSLCIAALIIMSVFVGEDTYAAPTPVISGLNPGETVYIVTEITNSIGSDVNAWISLKNVVCSENGVVEPEQEWYTAHQVQEKNDIDAAITFGLWINRDDDKASCGALDTWVIKDLHVADVKESIFLGEIPAWSSITVVTSYHMDEETENWAQSDTMTFDIELTREEVSHVARTFVRDTTPPVIFDVKVRNITETSATITWKTDENSTSRVEYDSSTAENKTLVTSHLQTLVELRPETAYRFKVASRDGAGNEAVSEEYSFTTLSPPPPPPPKPAEFVLSVLTITPVEVQVGEEVTISLMVTNVGDLEGGSTVDLLVNGVKEQSKSVTLAGGAQTTVSFSVTKTTLGPYTVKVGDLTGSFTVAKPPTPAAFTFTGLVVSPADVAPGAEVTASVTVSNTGEQSGTYSVELKLGGATKETRTGTIAGGASTTVSFKVSSQTEGTHTVQVGDLTGSFTVTAPTVSILLSPGYIAGILILIIAAGASVYALYRRGSLPLLKRTPGANQ